MIVAVVVAKALVVVMVVAMEVVVGARGGPGDHGGRG